MLTLCVVRSFIVAVCCLHRWARVLRVRQTAESLRAQCAASDSLLRQSQANADALLQLVQRLQVCRVCARALYASSTTRLYVNCVL